MRKIGLLLGVFLVLFIFQKCSNPDPKPEPPPDFKPINEADKGLAAHWADVTLFTIRHSYPNSPTYSSRSLGYIGLTMYESVVNGSTAHKSVAPQLNGIGQLPLPEIGQEFNWTLSLNAAQASIIKKLYPHAQLNALALIDSLETAIYSHEILTTNATIALRSVAFGQTIAAAIYEWSKTDGGYQGYLHNFDPNYHFPSGPGYWKAPVVGQSASPLPLHPYWGNNRTFLTADATLPIPVIVPYSQILASDYYNLFQEVYTKAKSLTEEEKRTAAWWADDPTQTASPPGHSYNLATIAITTAGANMYTAAEVYAKVGMAVADAFICCWKCKYTYHSERPYPYIKAYIDNNYAQFWPEPPFPAFSSGHATQSAAAAISLISVFGENFSVVDNTYEKRLPDFANIPYAMRQFDNIWATAEECAYSRFLGGIHTRQDNEAGTKQGKNIGNNVVSLSWKK
jgi:hypothetical protein